MSNPISAGGANLDSLPAVGSAGLDTLGAVLAIVDAGGGIAKVAQAAHRLAVDAVGEGGQVGLAGLDLFRDAGRGGHGANSIQVGQAVETTMKELR